MRRATVKPFKIGENLIFLSTLSLRRATVSITALPRCSFYFYPRSPCGERQQQRKLLEQNIAISIHALLAESDTSSLILEASANIFLSTLSLRRATFSGDHGHISGDISIHALLAESDTIFAVRPYDAPIFLSTLSLRRATSDPVTDKAWALISIHALLAESDSVTTSFQGGFAISIHALLAESDSALRSPRIALIVFLSTLSLRRATANMRRWESPR